MKRLVLFALMLSMALSVIPETNINAHAEDVDVSICSDEWLVTMSNRIETELLRRKISSQSALTIAPSYEGEILFQGIPWGEDIYTVLNQLRVLGFPLDDNPEEKITNDQNEMESWDEDDKGYSVKNSGVRIYASSWKFEKKPKEIAGYPLRWTAVYCIYDTQNETINMDYGKTHFYMAEVSFDVLNYEYAYLDLLNKMSSIYGMPYDQTSEDGEKTGFYWGTHSGDNYVAHAVWYGENQTAVTLIYKYSTRDNEIGRYEQSISLHYGMTDSEERLKELEDIRALNEKQEEMKKLENSINDTSGL